MASTDLKKWFHIPADAMMAMTDKIPEKSLPKVPSWIYLGSTEQTATKVKIKKDIKMVNKKKNPLDGFFQNSPDFFQKFQGKIVASEDINNFDFTNLNVAIVGGNQMTVMHLEQICNTAKFVKVFQITPLFILPQTEKGIHKLLSHPLIIKNRRLFNTRVKSLLAIRYLDSQVQDTWLKRQLMPNSASGNKVFLKSDRYYTALQQDNCKLITWPVVKITENAVQSMEGVEHLVDIIITTY